MNIFIRTGSRLYRFSSVCLLVIVCLGCSTTPKSMLETDNEKFDSEITLEREQRINIYTKDKRIVSMNGYKIKAKKFEGKLLVIDSGDANGYFAVFDMEEVRGITVGGVEPSSQDVMVDIAYQTFCFLAFLNSGSPNFHCGSIPNDYERVEWGTQSDRTEDDYEIAFKWYQQAADQGDPIAMTNLGNMYAEGRGIAKDDKTALKWYELAVAHGIAEAKLGLGYWQIKAEQGHAHAQARLGWMYQIGYGVSKDYKTAIEWYRQAAGQGNEQAQFRLGWVYQTGRGVDKNDKTAIEWYRQAAEQGHAEAQRNLDALYLEGRGVTQDGDSNG